MKKYFILLAAIICLTAVSFSDSQTTKNVDDQEKNQIQINVPVPDIDEVKETVFKELFDEKTDRNKVKIYKKTTNSVEVKTETAATINKISVLYANKVLKTYVKLESPVTLQATVKLYYKNKKVKTLILKPLSTLDKQPVVYGNVWEAGKYLPAGLYYLRLELSSDGKVHFGKSVGSVNISKDKNAAQIKVKPIKDQKIKVISKKTVIIETMKESESYDIERGFQKIKPKDYKQLTYKYDDMFLNVDWVDMETKVDSVDSLYGDQHFEFNYANIDSSTADITELEYQFLLFNRWQDEGTGRGISHLFTFNKLNYFDPKTYWGVELDINKSDSTGSLGNEYNVGNIFDIAIKGSVGKGRIYNADHLYRAKRIEQVLADKGAISREFTDQQMLELAEIIKNIPVYQAKYPDSYYSQVMKDIASNLLSYKVKMNGMLIKEIYDVLENEFIYRQYEHGTVLEAYLKLVNNYRDIDQTGSSVGIAYENKKLIGWKQFIGWGGYFESVNTTFDDSDSYSFIKLDIYGDYTYQLSDRTDLLAAAEYMSASNPDVPDTGVPYFIDEISKFSYSLGLRFYQEDQLVIECLLDKYTSKLLYKPDNIITNSERVFRINLTKYL